MRSTITVDELDPRTAGAAQLDAWRTLAAAAVEPNPFFDPAVVVPAARHLPGGERVRVAVARDGDRWLACLPVTAERGWRRVPLPCAVGWQHPYAFLGTPLLAADAPERAAAGLAAIATHGRTRAFLALDTVRADGPVAALLRGLEPPARATQLGTVQRAALVRRPADDYVDGHRSGKRRREAARQRRRLATALGAEPTLEVRRGDEAAVERFLRLEAAGWKGRSGTALASDEAHAAFFRAVAGAADGALRAELLDLGVPDRTAAMLFALVAGDTAYAVKIAHDEELQPGAPGVALMTDAAGWFHRATTATHFDSCASPENPMINALWPDRRPVAPFVVTGGGPAGAVGAAAWDLYDGVRRRRAARRSVAAEPTP
jgi:CelD/BcsL family acetyltransferase involved in cellulose biosynthesis